jgi:N,N'-diacetyllegionaminate synthase
MSDKIVYQNFTGQELPDEWQYSLKTTAGQNKIEFFSTPFYIEAFELFERVGLQTYKIASGDITFFPLLKAVGRTGRDVSLSTGGSSLADVENALNILTKKDAFNLPVGISDHTSGNLAAIAAVAMGACVVEKHVTFDRSLSGPDHPFAMTMVEFSQMIDQILLLQLALGTGEKIPSEDELSRQHRFRRGVYEKNSYRPIKGHQGIWLWLHPEHKREF